MSDPVVDAAWLQAHLSDPHLVLVDTRPHETWAAGHLPGARHYDPSEYPLKHGSAEAIAEFVARTEAAFAALGIGAEDHVVFYETGTDVRAARAAWTLEYLGHPQVSVLDGGLDGSGIAVTIETAPAKSGTFRAAPRPGLLATAEQILQRDTDVVVLDTRRRPDYLGQGEAKARRVGRIPGALHRDAGDNLQGNAYKSSATLRNEFAALGLSGDARVVVYCGGGGRASQSYYALRRAGHQDIGVYLPSWNEWSARPELPVETG